MTHPNAHLFAELAERAKTKSDPFEGLQYRIDSDDDWRLWNPSITNVMPLDYGWQWRLKPESVTVEVWANIYQKGGRAYHRTPEEARHKAGRDCVAVAVPLTGTYTPGGEDD